MTIDPHNIHFDGVSCKTCGGTKRYISSRTCVICARNGKTALAETSALKQARLAVQMAAKERGEKRYMGHDCNAGHGGLRRASTGRCIKCCTIHEANRVRREGRVFLPDIDIKQSPPPRPSLTPANVDVWISCITPPTLAQLMGRRA